MLLLQDTLEERIDVPLQKYDDRWRFKEVEETGQEKPERVVDWKDIEGYLKPIWGVPYR
jgi:hypothetical protein